MLKAVVITGAAEQFIGACLESIKKQSYTDWSCQVVVDPICDRTVDIAQSYAGDNIRVHINEQRGYALPNTIKAIGLSNPQDDDIILTIDGDDWLYSENAFKIVAKAYEENPELLLTHGSWKSWPAELPEHNNYPYTKEDFAGNLRKTKWRASQLRTFKHKLWKHIKDEDLRDGYGDYFISAGDCAYMWPMMEMAGYDRIKFIPEEIYTYNIANPYSDHRTKLRAQMYFTNYIAAKPQYKIKDTF
jgi:glycosyltransferase involved in cell wall biosynthesis